MLQGLGKVYQWCLTLLSAPMQCRDGSNAGGSQLGRGTSTVLLGLRLTMWLQALPFSAPPAPIYVQPLPLCLLSGACPLFWDCLPYF